MNTSEEDIGICILWDNGASMPLCVCVCDDWGRSIKTILKFVVTGGGGSKVNSIQRYVIEFVMTGDRSEVYKIQPYVIKFVMTAGGQMCI